MINFLYHAGFINDDGGWDRRDISYQTDNFTRFISLIMKDVYNVIEADQERYCNLTNGGSIDYNDFIDCLENLKLTLQERYCKYSSDELK